MSQRGEIHWLYKPRVLGRSIVNLVWKVHIGFGDPERDQHASLVSQTEEFKREMAEEGFSFGQLPPVVATLCILSLKSTYCQAMLLATDRCSSLPTHEASILPILPNIILLLDEDEEVWSQAALPRSPHHPQACVYASHLLKRFFGTIAVHIGARCLILGCRARS